MRFAALFSLFVLFSQSHAAFALSGADMGYLIGIKNADYDIGSGTAETNAQTGIMAGVIAVSDMNAFLLRTGGYYTTRANEISAGVLSADVAISYIDVPVTLMYRFNEALAAFAGPVLAVKVADKCDGSAAICDSAVDNIESLHTAFAVGLNTKFHPNWGGEISYEMGLSDMATDTTANSISLGAIFIY